MEFSLPVQVSNHNNLWQMIGNGYNLIFESVLAEQTLCVIVMKGCIFQDFASDTGF